MLVSTLALVPRKISGEPTAGNNSFLDDADALTCKPRITRVGGPGRISIFSSDLTPDPICSDWSFLVCKKKMDDGARDRSSGSAAPLANSFVIRCGEKLIRPQKIILLTSIVCRRSLANQQICRLYRVGQQGSEWLVELCGVVWPRVPRSQGTSKMDMKPDG